MVYDSSERQDVSDDEYTQKISGQTAGQDAAADAAFLGIGGEIVQSLIPFHIGSFSFRKNDNAEKVINVCPSSLTNSTRGGFSNDVSIEKTIDFDEIINNIPAIQIREYAQDARIVQVMNAFRMFTAGWNAAKNTTFTAKIWNLVREFYDKIPQYLTEATKNLTPWTSAVDSSIVKLSDQYKAYVINLPFIMYYQIMTSKTNSKYNLPYNGKIVDASNGQNGWSPFNVGGLKTSDESLLGPVINFFGKHLKFNTTPVWDGNTTNDFPQIEVQLDLFNDDVTSAVNNFLFVNNIIPKNRFIQYHIFQHNPCVYDIKIEGYNRLYMCSANMTCDYKGVSRRPSDEFFKQVSAISKKKFDFGDSGATLKDRNMISIPDVYSLKLTFQSLLPNSLNNYLFRFTANNNIFDLQDDPQNLTKNVLNGINDSASKAGAELEANLPKE